MTPLACVCGAGAAEAVLPLLRELHDELKPAVTVVKNIELFEAARAHEDAHGHGHGHGVMHGEGGAVATGSGESGGGEAAHDDPARLVSAASFWEGLLPTAGRGAMGGAERAWRETAHWHRTPS